MKQGEEEEEEEEEGGGKALPPPPRRISVGLVAKSQLRVKEGVEKGEADLLLLLLPLLLLPPLLLLLLLLIFKFMFIPRRARAAAEEEEGVVSRRGVERPAARGLPRPEPNLRTDRSLGISLFPCVLIDEDGGTGVVTMCRRCVMRRRRRKKNELGYLKWWLRREL